MSRRQTPLSIVPTVFSCLSMVLLAACAHSAADSIAERASPAACAAADGGAPLGCANAVNLELMLANPADLDAPGELAPARGDAAFEAARRHREGRVSPLPGGSDYSSAASTAEAEPR